MKYPTATPYGKVEMGQLRPYRQIFNDSLGYAFGIKGLTAFNLLDKYSKGDDITGFLDFYPGANMLRVFLYTPVKDWGDKAWDMPDRNSIINFITDMRLMEWYVELVLLTDDDPKRVQPAIDLVHYLTPFKFSNLLLEVGNEPLTHKNIDITALYNVCNGSSYCYSSGVYEDLTKFYGSYGTIHTPRDNEWPRKAKDAIEAYRGGGPNSPNEPPCKVPWILDEPIRPDQALDYGNEEFVIRDYYSYGALSRLAGGGVTFHCESAKLTQYPSSFEKDCFEFLMLGYEMFPPDSALGDYEHRGDLEDGQEKALRVYRVGHYAVVIRPNNFIAPPNWEQMDDWSVCWKLT